MSQDRRSFLAFSGSTLAGLFFAMDPDELREALLIARQKALGEIPPAWEYLTAEQAADIEAIASQIMPSDDTPGAREAGVVYFVDHALATWAPSRREPLTKGLDELNREVAKRWPGTTRFAALPAARQTELLRSQEKTEFFGSLRKATVVGCFCNPSYGGNRNKVGWQLLGFEDRYVWQPPFGDYDAQTAREGR